MQLFEIHFRIQYQSLIHDNYLVAQGNGSKR